MFIRDIEINDVRNRYLLTKEETQREIHEQTGAGKLRHSLGLTLRRCLRSRKILS